MERKLFTPSEANELLPQLKEDLAILQTLVGQIENQYLELQKIKTMSEKSSVRSASGEDPFFEIESKLDFMQIETELLINNFERRGVMLKMINPGLIDFPAVLNGEEILICWREGEESVTHYHGWDDGFAGRKALPDA
ncbi:DUF2203 domain-containing protein [Cohnella silvisoli]|uniref:DUF2203 domain-containing protein n=1 Tax=Cohnella silvisoli TaxID=2873699 RepID=A0ABV1L1F6_9BACL|nr:DUF2203 domain-containing protein [Cohnella silvisoli]MCD9025379.1 DUF2203 domain-containing protein [Cohnella silvisoli]